METKLIMNNDNDLLSHASLYLWLPFCFRPLTSAFALKGNDFCFLFSRQLPNISEQNNTALPQQTKTGARKSVTRNKEKQKNVIPETHKQSFFVCVRLI